MVQPDDADIEAGVYDAEERIIELPLRNAGSGIALLGPSELDIDPDPLTWRAAALHTAVRAGESTRIDFRGWSPDKETARSKWRAA